MMKISFEKHKRQKICCNVSRFVMWKRHNCTRCLPRTRVRQPTTRDWSHTCVTRVSSRPSVDEEWLWSATDCLTLETQWCHSLSNSPTSRNTKSLLK
ncbi:hypothetical protein RRG08_064106 [Elysia crispata]|uniref:Uncharacterized protein n=1 Tax=Elysia crispata TaxID=231223 RepID=A0AAE1A5S7_9GAST|nr:hypothetical protein RRG08_064106 [Elysia crispata]